MIVDLARFYVGVPWRHQGRTRQGLDCVGLIYRVWCDLGLDPSVDGTGYGHVSDGNRLRRIIDRLLVRVERPHRGGVVLMAQRGLHPLHVGLITVVRCRESEGQGVEKILHANARTRKVIEQSFIPALGLRPVAYYQYPEVTDRMANEKGERSEGRVRKVQHAPFDLCPLTSDI